MTGKELSTRVSGSVDTSRTDQTRLTTTDPLVDDFEPAWSPDGNKIAFVSDRDGNREIYFMNAGGSGQTRLTNDPASDLGPAWSPN